MQSHCLSYYYEKITWTIYNYYYIIHIANIIEQVILIIGVSGNYFQVYFNSVIYLICISNVFLYYNWAKISMYFDVSLCGMSFTN